MTNDFKKGVAVGLQFNLNVKNEIKSNNATGGFVVPCNTGAKSFLSVFSTKSEVKTW